MARFLATISSEMQAIAVGWQVYGLTTVPRSGPRRPGPIPPRVLLFLVSGTSRRPFPAPPHRDGLLRRFRRLLGCAARADPESQPSGLANLCGPTGKWRSAVVQRRGRAIVPAVADFCGTFSERRGLEFLLFTVATILGPAIGGLLYGLATTPAPVYASAAAGCLSSLMLASAIRVAVPPRKAATMRMVFEGLHFIRRKQLVLGAISLDLFAVLLGGATALLPAYADGSSRSARPVSACCAADRQWARS